MLTKKRASVLVEALKYLPLFPKIISGEIRRYFLKVYTTRSISLIPLEIRKFSI